MSAPAGGLCPHCGVAHLPGQAQCRHCGTPLGSAPESAPNTPAWVLAAGHPQAWRRLTACLLDLGVCGLGALALLLMSGQWMWAGAWTLVFVLASWVALARSGRTLGNAAVGLRVVSIFSGGPPGGMRAALRVLMFAVSMALPVLGPLVLVLSGSLTGTGDGRGWLEQASGTTVLRDAAEVGESWLAPSHQRAAEPVDPVGSESGSDLGQAAGAAGLAIQPAIPPRGSSQPAAAQLAPNAGDVIDQVPGFDRVEDGSAGAFGPRAVPQPAPGPAPVVIPPPESDAQVGLHPPVGEAELASSRARQSEPDAAFPEPAAEDATVASWPPGPVNRPADGARPDRADSAVAPEQPAGPTVRHQVGPGASAPARVRMAETAQIPILEDELEPESGELDYRGEEFVLLFDTSQRVVVGGNGLIGRNPTPAPGEEFAHIIPLHDPERSVSKTHLEFGIDEHGLWVRDRGSTNGTVIMDPEGGRTVVGAGQKVHMDTEGVLFLGDRSMRIGLS